MTQSLEVLIAAVKSELEIVADGTVSRSGRYQAIDRLSDVLTLDAVGALITALEQQHIAVLEPREFNTAKLINKFYTRYPLESFKSDGDRAEALGYYMAGAEIQHFGDFVVYEMPETDDEGSE